MYAVIVKLVKHTEHSSSKKWSKKTAMQPRTSESRRKEQWWPPHFAALQVPAFISADILTAILALYSTVKIFEASPLLKEQLKPGTY